ncbi:heavy metal translocating P-type ATPase [Blastococcus saxobsidens]|uniref:Heavy metal-(Cd/Co/Hg/Pb/Zn)-translocating P-type ATPase n=1 Tax=Blastococcus saxobsidens TaxID=138336 RepID=A0A4Q7YBD5_9ACTN|nr:heavy metal translocating P-type ATPase [Blastococcus saxobsidens]RZU33521.1 heavy metal-(Cd/Co/Hg/Pb/Zn)-translocating P-type ATPase [Blastococcus saxobsidens]
MQPRWSGRTERRWAALAAAGSLPEVRWAALASALFAAGGLAHLVGAPAPLYWALYLACYAAGGWGPALAGLQALRERTLDVDLLMVVAAIGAAAIGQIFDGALLIVIFASSGALEAFATRRTADAVRVLSRLAPEQATLVGPAGDERLVPVTGLSVGDLVIVRPGERLPADGVVVDGASDVDQASITGEPLPVDKRHGDEVFASTANGTGVLVVRVGRDPRESVVARIGVLVEEASATKAKTQLFIERVEQRYSVGVVVATLLVFTVPLLFGSAVDDALLRAMTFMIVASPCAIVLATMPPLLSAIANAGRHGVLVRSAVAMEQLGSADLAAFDKTGTLTDGDPAVVEVRSLGGTSVEEVLRLAASAEAASEHPIGRAIVRAAGERGLSLSTATAFRAEIGSGVVATVGGRAVRVGAPTGGAESDALVDAVRAQGRTAVVVTVAGEPAGVLGLADRVRPEARDAVDALRRLLPGEPVLLTGDNRQAAWALAEQVGVRKVRAGLLPQDKVDAVRRLQADGHRVLLVGDGVNDAPALAGADVGVAMGGIGSDLALDSADVIVVRDDLSAVPAVVALSRRARRVVVQNLAIAGTLIGVLVLWGLVGTLPLPLGVAGHEGSTILVALNGLRLLRESAWRAPGRPAEENENHSD